MAQTQKELLVQRIEEEATWLDARAIEKTATLNFSESMWDKVLSDQMYPKGLSTISRMGRTFADLSDKYGETYLKYKCGFGVAYDKDNRNYCINIVEDWGDKFSITVNADEVQGSKDSFKVILGYIGNIAMYLEKDGTLMSEGYSPNSDQLHIIINADYKHREVSMSWSKNKSTFTLNAPADIETVNWDGKIETGLKRGWSQK